MENVSSESLKELEEELLKRNISGKRFKTFVGEQSYKDIPDNYDLKLLVLDSVDKQTMLEIVNNRGNSTPRVNRNTIIFLCPSDKTNLEKQMRRKLAIDAIERDDSLELGEMDRKRLKEDTKRISGELDDAIHRVYREIYIPMKDGLLKTDLGVPTYGENKTLDERVFDHLKSEQKLIDKLAPIVIQAKYLNGSDSLYTEQLWKSHLQTPGEPLLMNRGVLEEAIVEGLKNGLFGLAMETDRGLKLLYFNDRKSAQDTTVPELQFSSVELLLSLAKCKELREKEPSVLYSADSDDKKVNVAVKDSGVGTSSRTSQPTSGNTTGIPPLSGAMESLNLSFRLPKGKASDVMRIVNYLHEKYQNIQLTISASEGSITKQEFENKIAEAFEQAGIEINDL